MTVCGCDSKGFKTELVAGQGKFKLEIESRELLVELASTMLLYSAHVSSTQNLMIACLLHYTFSYRKPNDIIVDRMLREIFDRRKENIIYNIIALQTQTRRNI